MAWCSDKKAQELYIYAIPIDMGKGKIVPVLFFKLITNYQLSRYGGVTFSAKDKAAGGMKLTTHLHLVPRLRMRGAVLPLPQYAFMAWCSTKAQGQLYFYLTLKHFRMLLTEHRYMVLELSFCPSNELCFGKSLYTLLWKVVQKREQRTS
jgi:hypothetical protein